MYGRPPATGIGYIAAPKAISLLVWINPGQVRSKQPVFFEPSACNGVSKLIKNSINLKFNLNMFLFLLVDFCISFSSKNEHIFLTLW